MADKQPHLLTLSVVVAAAVIAVRAPSEEGADLAETGEQVLIFTEDAAFVAAVAYTTRNSDNTYTYQYFDAEGNPLTPPEDLQTYSTEDRGVEFVPCRILTCTAACCTCGEAKHTSECALRQPKMVALTTMDADFLTAVVAVEETAPNKTEKKVDEGNAAVAADGDVVTAAGEGVTLAEVPSEAFAPELDVPSGYVFYDANGESLAPPADLVVTESFIDDLDATG